MMIRYTHGRGEGKTLYFSGLQCIVRYLWPLIDPRLTGIMAFTRGKNNNIRKNKNRNHIIIFETSTSRGQ
jgi:hypothetical protein